MIIFSNEIKKAQLSLPIYISILRLHLRQLLIRDLVLKYYRTVNSSLYHSILPSTSSLSGSPEKIPESYNSINNDKMGYSDSYIFENDDFISLENDETDQSPHDQNSSFSSLNHKNDNLSNNLISNWENLHTIHVLLKALSISQKQCLRFWGHKQEKFLNHEKIIFGSRRNMWKVEHSLLYQELINLFQSKNKSCHSLFVIQIS